MNVGRLPFDDVWLVWHMDANVVQQVLQDPALTEVQRQKLRRKVNEARRLVGDSSALSWPPFKKRGPSARINPLIARRVLGGKVRYSLGVALGRVRSNSQEARRLREQLRKERFEFSVRLHAHQRRLMAHASTQLEEDLAFNEAERLALEEMRKLSRNGGRWLTVASPKKPTTGGGRPAKDGDVLARYKELRGRRGAPLSVRSAARILALETHEKPGAVESRLRRRIKSASKPTRK